MVVRAVLLVQALLLPLWCQTSSLTIQHPAYPPGDTAFAPGSLADLTVVNGFTAPLRDTSVRIFAQGEVFPATVISPDFAGYTTSLRILLPPGLPLGPAEVLARIQGLDYESLSITIVSSRFGFLPVPPKINGGQIMNLTHPVVAGGTVTLHGTGFGDANGSDVTASIAGQRLGLESIALAEGEPGVEELRFRLPSFLSFTGCYVPLDGAVKGTVMNAVHLAIAQTDGPAGTHWVW